MSVKCGSDTSIGSENGDGPADMGTYEIASDEDYIDEDVNSAIIAHFLLFEFLRWI